MEGNGECKVEALDGQRIHKSSITLSIFRKRMARPGSLLPHRTGDPPWTVPSNCCWALQPHPSRRVSLGWYLVCRDVLVCRRKGKPPRSHRGQGPGGTTGAVGRSRMACDFVGCGDISRTKRLRANRLGPPVERFEGQTEEPVRYGAPNDGPLLGGSRGSSCEATGAGANEISSP